MGLDNGIIFHPRNNKIKVPKRIERLPYIVPGGIYEVAYWRRYWALRGDIMEYVPKEEEKLEGFGKVYRIADKISLESIYKIVKNVYKSPKNFRESNADYWWFGTWHYFRFNIWQGIKMIRNIKWVIKHFEDVEVFFYDSY